MAVTLFSHQSSYNFASDLNTVRFLNTAFLAIVTLSQGLDESFFNYILTAEVAVISLCYNVTMCLYLARVCSSQVIVNIQYVYSTVVHS